MKYSTSLQGLWKAASKDKSRYALSAIRVDAEAGVAVATDGRIMATVDIRELLENGEQSFNMPLQALKDATKLASKGRAQFVAIRLIDGAVHVLECEKTKFIHDVPEGNFPNWQACAPAQDGYKFVVALNPELLLNLLLALRGDSTIYAVFLFMKVEEGEPHALVASVGQAYGVIMPMRGDTKFPARCWDKVEVSANVA